MLTRCVRRSDNARHYTYVVGVHKGVNPHWSEACAMHFFLLKEHCTTQRIKM